MPTRRFCLYRRSNGVYYLKAWSNGRPVYKSTHATSRAEALKAVSRIDAVLKPRLPDSLLQQFVRDFLTHAGSVYARRTCIIYRQALGHLLAVAGNIPLSSLTPRHYDGYKTRRLTTVKPVAVNIELRALKAAMATAVRWRLVEDNPFADGSPCIVPKESPVFFSREDFDRLLAILRQGWLREIVVFAVATGLRRGEICGLTWDRVDVERGLLTVATGGTFRSKGGKKRVVPLNSVALAILKSRVEKSPLPQVFHRGGHPIGDDFLGKAFKRALRDAGLPEMLHFHSLRHTFASWLVQRGESIHAVSKILGHSSVVVTERFYAHLDPAQLHSTVERLPISMS